MTSTDDGNTRSHHANLLSNGTGTLPAHDLYSTIFV